MPIGIAEATDPVGSNGTLDDVITAEQRRGRKKEDDIWEIDMDEEDNTRKFSDMTRNEKIKHIAVILAKIVAVLACLYLFICSLSLLSSGFQVLGGKAGGHLFNNDFLGNPIAGLIIGILVTVLVQSSSTSTSIVITMVGANILQVHEAIPIIMGANIGTSVTNTLVSLTQSVNKGEFRKAFAGATVHDMFNFLCVLILLPLEVASGYLERVTDRIIESSSLEQGEDAPDILKVITNPLTKRIIEVNKTVIQLAARGEELEPEASMVDIWCEYSKTEINVTVANASTTNCLSSGNCTELRKAKYGSVKCKSPDDFLFANTGMSDGGVGAILLIVSILVLCCCLVSMVRLLSSMMKGSIARIIKRVINSNFPKPFGWITGYLAIIVGALLTVVVQSSSVFTSTMTPLVGIGVISLKRMYPLTLGSNIGTTATGILAALATDGSGIAPALQLALCHFFFNITGIIIWYPIPFMRKLPIKAAKFLGNTTAKYRWFAVVYVLMTFFLIPAAILGLSFAGLWVMGGVLIAVAAILVPVVVIKILQHKKPYWLPPILRDWKFLPEFLRSLKPYDKVFSMIFLCKCVKVCKERRRSKSPPAYPIGAPLPGSIEKGKRNLAFENGHLSQQITTKI